MLNKKVLLFGVESAQAFLFRKRLRHFLYLLCMFVNGFTFSTVGIGKHSLFIVAIAVTQNIISSVIGNNSLLTEVSIRTCAYINNILYENESENGIPANKTAQGNKIASMGKAWNPRRLFNPR